MPNSGRDGLPPGVGETVPGRDSQARQSSGTTLLCQSIKCPYARAGAGARGDTGKVCAGALERSRPCPRGCPALERGGPRPRGRKGLERGGPRPRKRLPLERGGLHSRGVCCVVLAGRGATRIVVVLCMRVRCVSRFAFAFFCRF
jgi:hypothetical protein